MTSTLCDPMGQLVLSFQLIDWSATLKRGWPFSPPCWYFSSGFWGARLAWTFVPYWFLFSWRGLSRLVCSGLVLQLVSLYAWWSFKLKIYMLSFAHDVQMSSPTPTPPPPPPDSTLTFPTTHCTTPFAWFIGQENRKLCMLIMNWKLKQ